MARPPVAVLRAAAVAVDVGRTRSRRRVWTADGRALIEVRGLNSPNSAEVVAAVQQATADLAGVQWSHVEVMTGRLQTRFDPGLVTVDEVVAAVTEAETLLGLANEGMPNDLPDHPSDAEPVHLQALAVAANVAGLTAALAGRLPGLPSLPGSAAAAVALFDTQPRLRRTLERRLGAAGADLALGVANAAVLGLSQGTASLAVDTALRVEALLAAKVRRDAFLRCHDDLCAPQRAATRVTPAMAERPLPRPPGPVERLADRAAFGSLLASGALLGLTGNVDLAGHAALVGVPRAARFAREGFAATIAMVLARRNQIVLDDSVLRRLDRVSDIVVDAKVLDSRHPMVLEAQTCADDWTPQHVWMAAQRLVWADAQLPVPLPPGRRRERLRLTAVGEATARGVRTLELRESDRLVGTVLACQELDPFTDALLIAARRAGLRLILTDRANLAELSARADEVLSAGADLVAEVRRLQANGAMVAVVSGDADAALAAADVGVGVGPASAASPVPWTADVLCGPSLSEVCRLLFALPVAASVSSRGVTLSVGGGFLGALLLALPGRGGRGRATLPGTIAAGIGLVEGTLAGLRVGRRADPAAVLRTPWHALEPAEVLARLPRPPDPPTVPTGRVVAGLRSVLMPMWPPVKLLVDLTNNVRAELADPLTPVLTTGAAASAVIGSPADAVLVGGVLAANALISGAQRLRADRALRVLLLDQQIPARRVSPGQTSTRAVRARDLRPGDILELRVNDVVPADARILSETELEVDEASLTGESVSTGKQVHATPGAGFSDRACMLYESTTILAGAARAVVVATGDGTEAGRALAIAAGASAPAGMQVRLQELTRRSLPVTLLGGAAVTGLGLLRRPSFRSAIASGVSVAVAAVPEGLPLVATVAQLSAARRLSRLGVLVRSSRTIEALGRVDTVCFDKTGTLTQGRLRLVRVAGLDAEWEPTHPSARRVLLAAARACPEPENGQPAAHATDRAVLDAARTALSSEPVDDWQQLAEMPFQSGRGYSAAVGQRAGAVRLVVKGAPEVLLPRCTHHRDGTGKHRLDRAARQRAAAAVDQLASQGLRVLAVGRRKVEEGTSFESLNGTEGRDPADLAEDLTLLGFVALADTPRPEARPTVDVLRNAGLAPVMITGDHPATARAIAEDLGIPADCVVNGTDLDGLDELAETARVTSASVFARVSPEQKVRIVAALRRAGRAVAMTGDGANDAAAIRVADVGIAMAAHGSTSARTAADLVLTEPDVGLILESLVEGRAMWQRVRDAVSILVGGNAGEVAFTLAGTALSGRAPIGTRQFLLVNLLTDLAPSMAVALAPTDRSASLPVLLSRATPSLGGPLLHDIAVRGGATSLGALTAWQIGRITGRRRRASTMALAALVGTQLGQTLVVGGRNPVVVATGVGSAVVLGAVIQLPGVSHFFGCTPLGPIAWTTVAVCAGAGTLAAVLIPRVLRSQPASVELGHVRVTDLTGFPPIGQPVLPPSENA
ncbi:MAG TPA: cation-translocating P-type ATPase [Frankiaceae bacterium]|nr:cation-translocating P-type ATPase [Frankiaceae bacterium]